MNRQTQGEMNRTAANDFAKADAELNRVYRQLLSVNEKRNDKKAVSLLRDAQRAWIGFRDAQALFEAQEMEGGSAYPLLRFGALTRTTEARTRQLKEALQHDKELRS